MSEYKKILELIEKQNRKLEELENLIKNLTKEKPTKPVEKNVQIKHTNTTLPALLVYLKEDKFFETPKTLNDIVLRLKDESRTVKSTSLTMPLQKLVRSRELGRLLKNGKWHYVAR